MADKPTYEELEQRIKELEKAVNDRTSTEKELKLLSLAVDQSSEGIAISDLDGNLEYLNHAFAAMHGYLAEELVGRHLSIFHTPEQMPSVEAANLKIKQTGDFNGEIWHLKRDGTVFPAMMHNSLIRDETNKPIGMLGTLRDITDIRLAEEALRESEDRYHAIFDQAADSIMLVEAETGTLVEFNEMAYKNLGYTREEFEKLKISDFEVIESDEEVAAHIKKVVREGVDAFETKHRTKGGEIRDIHVSSRAISILGKDFIQSIWRDITDQKRMEESLRYSKERYQALSDATFESVFISEKGILADVNQRAIEMFGYRYDEFIGMTAKDLTAPEYIELVEHNILSGYEEPYEAVFRKKDGSTFHAEIHGKMTRYKNKKVRVAVIHDIDARKRAEAILHKAHDELEDKIKERTAELEKSKHKLSKEIEGHKKTEKILRKREKDLETRTKDLEELNAALKVLLDKREEDKVELQDNILSNVKALIQPYVEKLKQSRLPNSQKTLINILESNLNEIVTPFSRKLSSKLLNLSPAEIQVANLVKYGKTNKEIAEISHVSPRTIAFHRENIRKKLGIKNQKTNLKTYLMSLD